MCDREGAQKGITKTIFCERYEIQRILGEGGMGKVFLAKDIKTRKKVALKIVKNEDQWEREKNILEQLNCVDGIPKLFFAGKAEEIFLVMEYIPGQSLKKHEKICGKLSEKDMILWMIKVCKVLQKVHEKGIVHMDLKPENIILHPSGKLYLIDFGVSLIEGEILTGYGTKNYASKKQKKSGEKAEFSMDIYSVGKIMQLNTKDQRAYDFREIIQKCLYDEKNQNEYTIQDIKKDLINLLWKKRIKKSAFLIICLGIVCGVSLRRCEEKKKTRIIYEETDSEELKKGIIYFYGNDETEKDLILARQYFRKDRTHKEKAQAYLLLSDLMDDSQKTVFGKDLEQAFVICEKDVHDFWSAYFFEHSYIIWSKKLSKNFLKRAQKLLDKMRQYRLDEKKKTILESEQMNLYELMAENGDTKQFFEETDRGLKQRLNSNKAWELYKRKLLYLENHGMEVQKEFERFLKFYPKVMEAYVEYGIYLCQKNEMEKAKDIYLEGLKQTGMTSRRAQGLRRKLGL